MSKVNSRLDEIEKRMSELAHTDAGPQPIDLGEYGTFETAAEALENQQVQEHIGRLRTEMWKRQTAEKQKELKEAAEKKTREASGEGVFELRVKK
jgi:hypothetical protein